MKKVIIDTTVDLRFVGGKVRVTLIRIFMRSSDWAGNFSNHLTHRNSLNVYKNPMKQGPWHPHCPGERWAAPFRPGTQWTPATPGSKPAPLLCVPTEGTERQERVFVLSGHKILLCKFILHISVSWYLPHCLITLYPLLYREFSIGTWSNVPILLFARWTFHIFKPFLKKKKVINISHHIFFLKF